MVQRHAGVDALRRPFRLVSRKGKVMEAKRKGESRGKPLKELAELTPEQLQRFRALWVTTAEELLAMSVTLESRQRLATYLGMSQGEFETLLAEVRAALDPEVAEEMGRATRGGHRFGVLDEIPEGKRRGRWPTPGEGQ